MEAVGETYITPLKSKDGKSMNRITNKMGTVKHGNDEDYVRNEKDKLFEQKIYNSMSARREKNKAIKNGNDKDESEVIVLLKTLGSGIKIEDSPGIAKQKQSKDARSGKRLSTASYDKVDDFQKQSALMDSEIDQLSEVIKAVRTKSHARQAMGCSGYLSKDKQQEAAMISQNLFNNFNKKSESMRLTSQRFELMDQNTQDQGQSMPHDPLSRFSEAAMRGSAAFQRNAELSMEKLKEFESIKKQHEEKEKQLEHEKQERSVIELKLRQHEETLNQLNQKFQEERQRLIADKIELESKINEKARSKERQIQDFEQLKKELENADATINSVRGALQISEAQRVAILNQLQEVRGNLRIYCRVRPIKSSEERVVILSPLINKEITMTGDSSKRGKPHTYHFDRVFGESTLQDEVFLEVEPFVQSMLDGKRVSIFAYGPTGSGKTHTLEGVNLSTDCLSESSGSMPRSLALIVDWIIKHNLFSEPENHLEVSLSCLEIYNERLRDLLSEDKPDQDIQILFNKGKVILPDIIKRPIATVADALDAIKLSSKRRHTEATAWNSTSSRSHSIYRISIAKKIDGCETGLLNIIDMAGSEKNSSDINAKDAAMSNSKTNAMMAGNDRLKKIQKEANFINKSLTTLGRIIRLIKQQRTMGIKEGCIPYRESKLTRLLQDCIGGDAQTLMIVNINPSVKSAGQTKETLNFASTACI